MEASGRKSADYVGSCALSRSGMYSKQSLQYTITIILRLFVIDFKTFFCYGQDIFNAVIKSHPTLVYKLPCQWNFQLANDPEAYNVQSEICDSIDDTQFSIHVRLFVFFNIL